MRLSDSVDTKIVILNDKLLETVGAKTPLSEAFDLVNEVLAQGVSAISDLISVPGEINVDFMDVRSIMGETGGAVMGVGLGKGENRATESVKKACSSPLQEKIVIEGAQGVLMSITASSDVTLQEINQATTTIYEAADPEANIIFGMVIDPELKDEMRVTIIATGFPEDRKQFPKASHPKEEELASPKTDLDLDTKLRSMFGEGEKSAEAEEDLREPARPSAPSTSEQRPAQQVPPQQQRPASYTSPDLDKPRSEDIPAAPRQEMRRPEPVEESSDMLESDAQIETVGEEENEEQQGAGAVADLNEPAYIRRRRTLFE
jgi:hypothetical protein